jgi:hypothetical protein
MLNAMWAAVVCDTVGIDNRVLFHDGAIDISGVNDVHIYMRNSGVVGKGPTPPFAADEADSPETEAVVDAAIVADVVAPIAFVETIMFPFESPVGWGPQSAHIRSRCPCAGNPKVVPVVRGITPVAWSPHQVRLGTRRLHIDRQHRRCKSDIDTDTDAELGLQARGYH